MKVFTTFAALLVTCSEAQINFVPASVLIPVHNISLWNITKPALNTNQWNNTVPKPPRWYGPSYPYYPSWNNTTPSGDLIVGKIGYLDRLLFNQVKTYFKASRWWSGREKIIEYPKDLSGKYSYNRYETISAIRVYNKLYDSTNTKAEILAGGVGYRYVKIKLSSNWNKGFKYLIQIFGH